MQRITPAFVFTALTLAGSLAPVSAGASEYVSGDVVIKQPWSRPTPPGTPVGVGYMTIHNRGEQAVTLVSGESPVAERVTIHESVMQDGLMKMRPLRGGLGIPPGATIELRPHSYHLMLEQLSSPLREGEQVPLTLTFDRVEPVSLELSVGSLDRGRGMGDHTGH
ncbi:hypothetical protein SAMN05216203_2844 [Marinobacter daqiaonensis]|uniref:Copper(I)-binding protein n=1 Tax=Marinobacter daqiaonensis TaxID=650891 RepID=A0A1I6JAU5_9GAMM|nr:copper chaperone PCu(A)C [Marinobacter daqiaonensis]SFR76123.1 hypothetical protein SAMN05216203_2844 [Marinobacter daqiaonensis]